MTIITRSSEFKEKGGEDSMCGKIKNKKQSCLTVLPARSLTFHNFNNKKSTQ
jgi:hypothetical protein